MPPWRMLLAPRIPQHILGEWRWLETQTTSAAVRDFAGKVGISAVPDLPRTQTGKLSEIAVREAVHGREVKGLGALANPDSLHAIVAAVPR